MNETIKMTAHVNSARTTAARLLLALGLTGVMAVPAMAASVGNTAAQNIQARNGQIQPNQTQPDQTQNRRSQRQPGQNAPDLKVTYYTADPSKGGKIISTLTLTRPARPQGQTGSRRAVPTPGETLARPRPVNPVVAQAPAGATFAVVQGGRGGERVIDLAQADQMGGPGMGGPGMGGPGGRDGGPRGSGPDQKGQGQQGQDSPPRN
ncbi:hypothetical protein [Deinococcus sp.]|uniref:hypothetical protein n=1 Tax=Deinococcus sp. TaxID=47478 RepID=UPI0025FC66C4|nr:hypothetical protein [Deinococcus sp.]